MLRTDLTAPGPRRITATLVGVVTFGLTAGTGTDWITNDAHGIANAIATSAITWCTLAAAHVFRDREQLRRANRVLRHQQAARDNVIALLEAENAGLRGTRKDQEHLIAHLVEAHRSGSPIHPAIRAKRVPSTTQVSA